MTAFTNGLLMLSEVVSAAVGVMLLLIGEPAGAAAGYASAIYLRLLRLDEKP